MRTRARVAFVAVLCASELALACSTETTAGPRCIPGASQVCGCADARSGGQVCRADGTFDPCACAGNEHDAGVDEPADGAEAGGDGSPGREDGAAGVDCSVAQKRILAVTVDAAGFAYATGNRTAA